MDRTKYDIEIKHHVFKRALQRNIHPDLIENVILNGKIERFGKNHVKFIKKGKRTIICMGEITSLKIKILTIEVKGDKK